MKKIHSLFITAIFVMLDTAPSLAGAQAFNCANASGEMTYDGAQLTYRNAVNPTKTIEVKSRKISETIIATSEETCINKAGQKFIAGSTTSLLVLEYPQSWDQKTVQGEFLCSNIYDGYPNVNGVDTKCVKTITNKGRLRDTSLVTETTEK